MNGGTNLALAIETAGIMMKDKLPTGSPRTVILLTDGRVDYYQGMSKLTLQLQQVCTSVYYGAGMLRSSACITGCCLTRARVIQCQLLLPSMCSQLLQCHLSET